MQREERLEKIRHLYSTQNVIYPSDVQWVLEELSHALEVARVQMTVLKEIAKPLSEKLYDFRPQKYAEEWIGELNKLYFKLEPYDG